MRTPRFFAAAFLISAALSLAGTAPPPQKNAPPAPATHPAQNRDPQLLFTYVRTGGMRADHRNFGLVFALWDDGWAITNHRLRDDSGRSFCAVHFSKEAMARITLAVKNTGADDPSIRSRGIPVDASFGTLEIRSAQGVRHFDWTEWLSPSVASPDERAFIAMWLACTSCVMSEVPDEILDERDALKGGVFRGRNPNDSTKWRIDE